MEFVQICKIDAFPPFNDGNGVQILEIDIDFRNHRGPLIAKILITPLYYFRMTRMDQNTIIIQDLPNYNITYRGKHNFSSYLEKFIVVFHSYHIKYNS